jgi:predicted alpha/beta superfamily hydrolase
MKYTIYLVLLLLSIKLSAQEIIETDIHSTYLGEVRIIKIYIPKDYESSGIKHPLTVVLDSDLLFDTYVSISELCAKEDKVPSQIVVGISQEIDNFKERDYGYNLMNSYPTNTSMNAFEFINSEVLMHMKENYRIANFKTIIGNKLTANFTNYFLIENEPVFNAYININPLFAPDMPEYIMSKAFNLKGNDYFYYMSSAESTQKKIKETILSVDKRLVDLKNLYFNYKYDQHSVSETFSIPISISNALNYIYTMYSSINAYEYETNIAYLSPDAAIEYLLYKYENIEYAYGKKMTIRKEDFIAIEAIVIDKEDGNSLQKFGELALENFPKAPLGDYYIGLFHEKKENYNEALLAYKKGLGKIPVSSPKASGFFRNVKRVSSLKKLQKAREQAPRELEDEESIE